MADLVSQAPQVFEVAVEALTKVFMDLAAESGVDLIEEECPAWARAAVSTVFAAYGLGPVSG